MNIEHQILYQFRRNILSERSNQNPVLTIRLIVKICFTYLEKFLVMVKFEYAVLFISTWSISLIKCDPDSVDYCKKDAMHSCCKRKDPEEGKGCHTMLDGITEFRKSLLKKHNELRAKTANGNTPNSPKASNMNALSYSLDLEYTAWCNAATCSFDHEKKANRRDTEGFRAAGQNLAYHASTGPSQKTHIEDIEGWYKESDDITADIIKNFPQQPPKMIGHYTQLVAACATHVGCARSTWNITKNGMEFIKELLACNYGSTDPACYMNLIGGAVYLEGDPCSACPKDRPCSVKYPGLCGEEVEVNSEWKPPLTIYKLFGEEKSGGGGGGGSGQGGGDTNETIDNPKGAAYHPKPNHIFVVIHLILAFAALQLIF